MSDSLNAARKTVTEKIQNGSIPAQLIGEITLDDLVTMCAELVAASIKEHLSAIEAADDEQAEQILTGLLEMTAIKAALIGIQATIQEATSGTGSFGDEPDIELGVAPETVAVLIAELMSSGQVTIRLTKEDE